MDGVEVHKLAKKERDQKSLVNKGFIIWLPGIIFSRDTARSPERVR